MRTENTLPGAALLLLVSVLMPDLDEEAVGGIRSGRYEDSGLSELDLEDGGGKNWESMQELACSCIIFGVVLVSMYDYN